MELEYDRKASRKTTKEDGVLHDNDPQTRKEGRVFSDKEGRSFVVLRGSEAQAGKENFFSGDKPTIHITAGIDDGVDAKQSSESVSGYSSDFDAVILPGRREDYMVKMPDIGDYPSTAAKDIWQNQESLYGSALILEHVNGDTISLRGVEMIVFDHENSLAGQKPKKLFDEYEKQVEKGGVSFYPATEMFKELEAGMMPEEVLRGKIAASRNVAGFLKENWSKELTDEFKNEIVEEFKDQVDGNAAYNAPSQKAFEENAPALGYNPGAGPSGPAPQ